MLSIESIVPTLISLSAIAGVTAFHEAGHLLAAKSQGITVQSYNIGIGPKLIAFNDSSNTEFALRVLPLGGFVAFPNNLNFDDNGDPIGEKEDPNLLQNRPPLQRALVISGGVLANILLTFLLSCGIASTTGLPRPVYNDGIVVTSRLADSPATKAGVQVNDVITSLNEHKIKSSITAVNEFVTRVRTTPPDQVVNLEIVRPSPSSTETIKLQIIPSRSGNGRASIGIGVAASMKESRVVKAFSIFDAVYLGVDETKNLFQATFSSLSTAVSTGFSGTDVGGPLAIIEVGAEVAGYSPVAVLGFASFLSVNLAVLNSLPLPALDGGQLVFVLVELVSGRRVPQRVQEALVGVAYSLLLIVAVGTFVGDISRFSDPIVGLRQPTAIRFNLDTSGVTK